MKKILMLLAFVLVLASCSESPEKYKVRAKVVADSIKSNSDLAVSMCSVMSSEWRKAIFDSYGKDFNVAIAETVKDYANVKTVLDSRGLVIDSLMKTIEKHPDETKDLYEELKTYYASYMQVKKLAFEPSGSLQTYVANVNKLSSDIETSQNKLLLSLPK